MAKDKERKQAKAMYMQGKTNLEIARIVKVQPKTISEWDKKYKWKAEREARVNSTDQEKSNLRTILADITEKKLENMRAIESARSAKDQDKLDELYGKQRAIADEYSKWNKRLQQIESNDSVPLTTYIKVLEEFLKDVQKHKPELFVKIADFQEEHLQRVIFKMGL